MILYSLTNEFKCSFPHPRRTHLASAVKTDAKAQAVQRLSDGVRLGNELGMASDGMRVEEDTSGGDRSHAAHSPHHHTHTLREADRSSYGISSAS